jgi:hypothetical protein
MVGSSMKYQEIILNEYQNIKQENRLVLFSLSRIQNCLSFLTKNQQNIQLLPKNIESTFLYVENTSILSGIVWENIQYYCKHKTLRNVDFFKDNMDLLLLINQYIREFSKENSFINFIIKPLRNKYLFHFDDTLFDEQDTGIINNEEVNFLTATSSIRNDTYYNLPLLTFQLLAAKAYERSIIKENDINHIFNETFNIAHKLYLANETVLIKIIEKKGFKRETEES